MPSPVFYEKTEIQFSRHQAVESKKQLLYINNYTCDLKFLRSEIFVLKIYRYERTKIFKQEKKMYSYSLIYHALSVLYISAISIFPAVLNVSGTITSDTTWDVDTVIVTDTVTLTQNSSLTIKSGTNVLFQKQTKLQINGSLYALGAVDDSIIFTAHDPNAPWCGIVFGKNSANDSSIVQFCIIEQCGKGYAVEIDGYNTLDIHNCTIQINNNGVGFKTATTIKKCSIKNNSGIGIEICSGCSFYHCVIENNALGGLLADRCGNVIVENCLITGNGEYGVRGEKPGIIINNCTIADNKGDGVFLTNEPMPEDQRVLNSIIWNNSIYNNGYLWISHCCVKGFLNGGNIENIINKNPCFSNTHPHPYSILNTSPCINMGENSIDLSEKDLTGNPRIYDGKYDIVDIGAYEFQGEPVSPILDILPENALNNVTGENREDTLSFVLKNVGSDSLKIDSIKFTSDNYSVLDSSVLHTYLNFKESATLRIVFSSTETGSFIDTGFIYYNNEVSNIGTGFDVFQTCYKNQSVSGTWKKSDATYALVGCITVPVDSTLIIEPGVIVKSENGKLVVNGRLVAKGSVNDTIVFSKIHNHWDGILLNGEGSLQDSSIISFCKVEYSGGIKLNNISRLRISNCNISNNRSTYTVNHGTCGIYCDSSSPLICNNSIMYNGGVAHSNMSGDSYITGGGIICDNISNALIMNNLISNNTVYAEGCFPGGGKSYGGGIYCINSNPIIFGNVIKNNGCSGEGPLGDAVGGGVYLVSSRALLLNNTIVNNYTENNGFYNSGGVRAQSTTQPIIINCIIWNNSVKQIHYYNPIDKDTILDSVQYCSIQEGYLGTGNQSDPPLFNDTSNGDWTLSKYSPCINSGTPDTSGLCIPKYDLAGNPRLAGNRIDIGAYESSFTPIIHTDLIGEKVNPAFRIEPCIASYNDKTIKFFIQTNSVVGVSLKIYDALGNMIFASENKIDSNIREKLFVEWDKKNKNSKTVGSGTYLVVFVTIDKDGNRKVCNKMIGIKHPAD